MLKTSSKYIFVFLSLCLGFSFALEAQEKGVLVAKEGAFSDFTLDTALVDMLSAIATDKETISIYAVAADASSPSQKLKTDWVHGGSMPFTLTFDNKEYLIYQARAFL